MSNTGICHLVGRDTANPKHPNRKAFSLRFSELSPYAVQEILELSEAQEQRFIKAFDLTKRALEACGVWPRTPEEKAELLELDEFEQGYPCMMLEHLYDVIQYIAATTNKEDATFWTPAFKAKAAIRANGTLKSPALREFRRRRRR